MKNLFKKIKLYFEYLRTIKSLKKVLFSKYFIKIDYIGRMYTVQNLTDIDIANYNDKELDFDRLRLYINDLKIYLNNNGLDQMYKLYEIKEVNSRSYLMIFGFSFIDIEASIKKILVYSTLSLFFLLIFFLI